MKYPEYPNLKDTEVPWINPVPHHWELKKFRYLFSFGRGLGITKKDLLDEGIPCISYGEIHSKYRFEVIPEEHELKCVPESYLETDPRSLLKEGDFVFADTSEDLEGSGNFSYLNSNIPAFAGYHTVIARLQTEDLPRYIAYLFDSLPYRHQIRISVSGVKVFSITQDILKSSYVWLPPKNEQEKIVKFLDCKTTKIDQLIEKKKALIEKLNEQRIAVITHAVTKGLDKNAKMKPSCVDWLGDVPEHWGVLRGKFIGKIASTPSLPENEITENEGRLSYIKVEDLNKPENTYFFEKSVHFSFDDNKSFTNNSIVFPKRGAAIFTNKATILTKPALIDPNLMSWELYDAAHLKFYYFSLLARRLDDLADTSTVPQINNKHILPAEFPSPPDNEKEEIVLFIEKEQKKFDSSIKVNQNAINRLEEYRAAIISAAVTGKIDVRNLEIG